MKTIKFLNGHKRFCQTGQYCIIMLNYDSRNTNNWICYVWEHNEWKYSWWLLSFLSGLSPVITIVALDNGDTSNSWFFVFDYIWTKLSMSTSWCQPFIMSQYWWSLNHAHNNNNDNDFICKALLMQLEVLIHYTVSVGVQPEAAAGIHTLVV